MKTLNRCRTLAWSATAMALLASPAFAQMHPERVTEQVTPVRKLVEARKRLSDLLAKLDGNDKLDELLQDVLASTDSIEKLGKETGVKEDKE